MGGWAIVRDIGGFVEGVRRAIEDGRNFGPCIHGSGPVIGQTSDHGGLRQNNGPQPHTYPDYLIHSILFQKRAHCVV